ncbi:MAG: ATP-dependent helicase [Candidatus Acetothermia bacterium]
MTDPRPLLEDLNLEQKKAVEHFEGPLLVLAGAGSGKTRVITRRIAYLIAERGVQPERILGLTFTNKAAQEMTERVENLLPEGAPDRAPWLGTFHSLGARILRKFSHLLDDEYDRFFTIFDTVDQKKVIKEVFKDLDLSRDDYSPGMVTGVINQAKNDLIGPDGFRSGRADQYEEYFLGEMERVYRRYQEKLRECNAFDFGDLIRLPVQLLRENPPGIALWKKSYRFLMVDEYQDTNHGQYLFARSLLSDHRNICVVGDDDQAIFGWRGADVTNLLEFEEDFPQADVIHLSRNYRSTQTILRAANSVIANNSFRKEKSMTPDRGRGGSVEIFEADDEAKEAEFVAREIDSLQGAGVPLGEIGVLYRVNTLSRQLEESFVNRGLPYEIVQGTRFYERQEVKDILAYLRVLANPEDDVSLLRIINRPRRGIGSQTQAAVQEYADRNGFSLWEGLMEMISEENPDLLGSRQQKSLQQFLDLMADFEECRADLSLSEWVDYVIQQVGYPDYLRKSFGSDSASDRLNNLQELVGQIRALGDETSLSEFLETVALETTVGRFEGEQSKVSLMTLHSAKGLEFSNVFLIGFEDGLLPHRQALQEGRLEEERRLCYVGMTRAKDALYISYSRKRFLYGQNFHNRPSRFLDEIEDGECIYRDSSSTANTFTSSSTKKDAETDTPGIGWRDFLDK